MKPSALAKISIIFLCCIIALSCSKDDEYDSPDKYSLVKFELEGEGGHEVVGLRGDDWQIVSVKNAAGGQAIWGDMYSDEGQLVRENSRLELRGLGRLDAFWHNKGFRIERETPEIIKLEVAENMSGQDFSFIVVLQSEGKQKEITVNQKKSEGYTFDKIAYMIKDGDKDSLYVKKGMSYTFNVLSPQKPEISLFSGVDIVKSSYFDSADKSLFESITGETAMVDVPTYVNEGRVYCNGQKNPFSNEVSKNDHGFKATETIPISAGKSQFYVNVEWRKRVVSFAVTLTSNRTSAKKIVEGKWIEYAPTGKSSIVWIK